MIFTGQYALGHFVLGMIAARVPVLRVPLTGVFFLYQILEAEPRASTIADLSEFALGALVGANVRA